MQRASGRAILIFAIQAALLLCAAGPAWGLRTTQPPLKHVTINVNNRAALRMGAVYFMHECMGCHSIEGARFSELARPLGLTKAEIQRSINISGRGFYDTIASSMPADIAKKLLAVQPPDLTVMSRLHSIDWLYTYLTSFYVDPSRSTGANNVVVHNVAMPDIFADLQGLQGPVKVMGYRYGQHTKIAVGVKPLTKGKMTPAQFDAMTKDIVTFLYYVGHPHQQVSYTIGLWVLGWLVGLTIFAYLLYKLYWRRVIRPEGGRWWTYWKR